MFENPYRCDHDRTEVRRRRLSNGVIHHWHQCVRCGHGLRAVRSDAAPKDAPAFDEELKERWNAQRSAWWDERRRGMDEAREQEQATFWESYDAYLDTPEWKDKRRLVLERAEFLCEGCRDRLADQVHHRTYDRVGHEMLFDLVAVCWDCHARLHPRMAAVVWKAGSR